MLCISRIRAVGAARGSADTMARIDDPTLHPSGTPVYFAALEHYSGDGST
jgi:hypothetical protein